MLRFVVTASTQLLTTLLTLNSCKEVIKYLKRAEGLRDVIRQMQSGEVQAIRNQYGPIPGKRKAHDDWSSVNTAVTRRERIYSQLMTEFGGDEELFFKFFAVDVNENVVGSRKSRKRKGETLRAMRLVAQAICWMKKDIQEEKKRPEYRYPGTTLFSDARWKSKWKDANSWEVWRALGLERYIKADTADDKDDENDSTN